MNMVQQGKPIVIMLCTAARGGMRTVVESYEHDGLFKKWNVQLVHTHDEGSVLKRLIFFAKALVKFIYLVVFKKIAFIHNHSAMRGSFWRKNVFSTLARMRGIPVILHLHGSEMESFYNSQSEAGKSRISSVLEKANAVVVLSKSWEDFVLKIAPQSHVHIIHNYVAVPDARLLEATGETKERHEAVKILFLGLIGRRKGVFDLIEAVKVLQEKCLGFHLYIGGNGEEKKAQNLVTKLNLGQSITFLGWVSGEQKNEYLSKTDIYILPSYNEGLPMSLLEAMSWQKPVVSTQVGGIPELVRPSKDGLLVEAGDVDAIAEALECLIVDEKFRLACGVNARNRVINGFSKEVIIPEIERLYKRFV